MSNSSYLCYWKEERLYPNLCKGYEPHENTLAMGVYTVPLLWLALFNKNDWQTQEFNIDGEEIIGQGPVTLVESALQNLKKSQNCLIPLLSEFGLTEEPFLCLAEYIEPLKGNFITIESEEIAIMDTSEDKFYGNIKTVLNGLSLGGEIVNNPSSNRFKEGLINFFEFEKPIKFYPLGDYYDNEGLNKNDYRNFEILLGGELYRETPWCSGHSDSELTFF